MFKKKSKAAESSVCEETGTRTIVSETVETKGGVQTTRTTITTTSKGDLPDAFKNLDLNSEAMLEGGTCITKKAVYTSSGKQVVEETVETFESKPTGKLDDYAIKDSTAPSKSGKSITERLGFKSSKSTPKSSTSQNAPSAENGKSSSGKSSTPASVKPGKFEDDCLKAHNNYRAKHGVPKLKLSKELCAYSKEWAEHLAKTDKFQHRTERKYGENIFMKWSSDPNHMVTGEEAVDSWYSEIKDHLFGREPTSLKSGHFTQVIWKKSTELGVAWARSHSGKILVVANYNPAGNLIGTFAENVPPPQK